MRQTLTLAEHVAARLRGVLAERRISKAELARRLGVDETWVGRRTAEKSAITVEDLERMAIALELPPSYFVPERAA